MLKYYVYVSDAKVDMLFAQLPRGFLDAVAAELKVNLQLLSVSFSQGAPESTRYSRLAAVCRYIDRHEAVGTIDSPKAYFRDSVNVRWAPLGADDDDRIVYFGGQTLNTTFGLGGSPHHVIQGPIGQRTHASSATPYLTATLCSELDLPRPQDLEISGLSLSEMGPSALHATRLATERMRGSFEHVEFLARRLLYEDKDESYDTAVLLGSPIYVALTGTAV